MNLLCLTLALSSLLAPTRLQENVTVSAGVLHLSDLLPDDAPEKIKSLAAVIWLGRAPNTGSARIFSRDEIARSFTLEPQLANQLSIPLQVTVNRQSNPIAETQVRAAIESELRKQRWPDDALPRQLLIPRQAIAGSESKLKILAIKWDAHHQSLNFQIRCDIPQDCGSFLVRAPMPSLPARLRSTPGPLAKPLLVAHAGERAMLTMRSGSLVMHIPVVCLQPGAVGDVIRAHDRTSHKIFRASVVSAGKLQAVAN
jgi:hypothetical protein